MEINGSGENVTLIRRDNGLYILGVIGLDGCSFMEKNRQNLEELMINGRIFDRVWDGINGTFYAYRERL